MGLRVWHQAQSLIFRIPVAGPVSSQHGASRVGDGAHQAAVGIIDAPVVAPGLDLPAQYPSPTLIYLLTYIGNHAEQTRYLSTVA